MILGRLVNARPDVRLFDMFDVLCPAGEFVKSMGGIDTVRTDGAQFSRESSLWFAEKYGREILDPGLG